MIFNGAITGKKLHYTVTATSTASGITVDPATQVVDRGGSAIVDIFGDSISNVSVKDNGTDIKSQLVSHPSTVVSGTATSTAKAYTTSGSISNSSYASRPIGVAAETTATNTGNMYASSSGSTAYVYYTFDLSEIPDGATINSVEVKVKGHRESSSSPGALTLMAGNTVKSNTTAFTSTTDAVVTVDNGSYTWTAAELKNNPRLRFTIGYYGGSLTGITWKVTYTAGTPAYWEYTLNNVTANHDIRVA